MTPITVLLAAVLFPIIFIIAIIQLNKKLTQLEKKTNRAIGPLPLGISLDKKATPAFVIGNLITIYITVIMFFNFGPNWQTQIAGAIWLVMNIFFMVKYGKD